MRESTVGARSLSMYRALVPVSIRQPLWNLRRRTIPRYFHDVRFRCGGREFAERHLALGNYFWLFILGCNNSGTTLLAQILASHPRVRALPKEGHHVTNALPDPVQIEAGLGRMFTRRLDLFRWTEEDDQSMIPRVRYDWACRFSGEPPGILLEKSPPDLVRSRWLQRNFTPARFIAIVRSPYAVAEGIRRRIGVSIEEAARHWQKAHEVFLEDIALLDHVLLVKYEHLCADPADTLAKLETFLELEPPFDRRLVDREFPTHSMAGEPAAIQDFNARSLARLTDEEVRSISRVAAPQMEQLHYERLDAVPRRER